MLSTSVDLAKCSGSHHARRIVSVRAAAESATADGLAAPEGMNRGPRGLGRKFHEGESVERATGKYII